MANDLRVKEFDCLLLHGDMEQADRNKVIISFKKNECPLLVCLHFYFKPTTDIIISVLFRQLLQEMLSILFAFFLTSIFRLLLNSILYVR